MIVRTFQALLCRPAALVGWAAVVLVGCSATGELGDRDDDCATYYPDVDGDGLGDERLPVTLCETQDGYVLNGDDPEPDCPTNDTDACGVCSGGNADQDCAGICFGLAEHDGCGMCAGGTTGVEPTPDADLDGDGTPDGCDSCVGDSVARFVVEYSEVPHYGGEGGPYTFAVALHDTGDILFSYGSMEPFLASANVGIQSPSGTLGVDVAADPAAFLGRSALVFRWSESEANYVVDDTVASPYGDLASVGSPLSLGDDTSESLVLPFTFPFYEESAELVTVSSNGFLFLGEGDIPGYGNVPFPTGEVGAMVAPLWDDLNPGPGGVVRFFADTQCAMDCAGVSGGFARVDSCEVCAGGTTGLVPDIDMDCANVCGGEASIDGCGLCSGGTTGREPSDPENCPNLPDFVPDPGYLGDTLSVDWIDVGEDSCLVAEGCVGGLGMRKVLRFGTRVGNIGTTDFHLGVPPGPGFHWDACHEHYHFDDYAGYRLLDPADGSEAAVGHKNGWCLMDTGIYDPDLAAEAGNDCNFYDCGNQGIGLGCQDTYGSGLDCQWIDITGVVDGTYQVELRVNPDYDLAELDDTNNVATATIDLSGDVVTYIGP